MNIKFELMIADQSILRSQSVEPFFQTHRIPISEVCVDFLIFQR